MPNLTKIVAPIIGIFLVVFAGVYFVFFYPLDKVESPTPTPTASVSSSPEPSIPSEPTQEGTFREVRRDQRFIYYAGNATVSGRYEIQATGIYAGTLCFFLDEQARHLMPGSSENSTPWFCFENQKEAQKMLSIEEKDATCQVEGSATINISNYIDDTLASEVYDTAKLQAVISASEPLVICLQ